uniref:hypothetical protein n=1 Tax=Endozoicomonas sp. SESOKO4 TaxID=2828745 RepID=UPI002148DD28
KHSTAGSDKKGKRDLGRARGRLIPLPDRKETVALIQRAVSQGARKVKACTALTWRYARFSAGKKI